MIFLKQSTAVDVVIGPFVDDTDGKTTEEALTLAQADLQLSKNGGTAAQKNDTSSATHLYGGNYKVDLNTTDTNTLGHLRLMCKESGALPIIADFMVVTANWYDTMFSTDQLDVNVTNIEGSDATDQINAACDTALADYDAPTKAELDSGLAALNDLSAAEVNAEVDTALADYDAPTKAELDAGFAALNDLSAAEVNAEVDTALSDIHLDHLLAVDYDPASKPGTATALLNELVESDAGVSRFTANALEEGSSGGDATAANQTTIINNIAALNDLSAAEVNAEVDTALADYDAPTKAELDAGFAALNDLSAAEVNAEVDTALADYDAPTKAELDAGFAALNDLSAAEVNAEVDTALADYDGPTNAEFEARTISATAAGNLEDMFDGTGYSAGTAPATQDQVSGITAVGGVANKVAESFTLTTGTVISGDVTETEAEDSTYHQIEDDTGTLDAYYQFDIGGVGLPGSVVIHGRVMGSNDNLTLYAYDWSGTAWDAIRSYDGTNGGDTTRTAILQSKHVGTGANAGKVRIRFYGTGLSAADLYVDQIYVTYGISQSVVGYANGEIWVDTNDGSSGTTVNVNGTADNPVDSWADALTLSGLLGLKRFKIKGGSSITLTADSSNYDIIGDGLFSLNLGSQTITNCYLSKANLSGTGNGTNVICEDCKIGDSTSIPPGYYIRCGIGATSGTPMTASGAGEFVLVDCVSTVAGSGTPYLDFSGQAAATGVNIRRWAGGINLTLDSDNTLSHEVLVGGGCTITTGGANCEIRGITRAVTITASAAETIQFVGTTGPITLNGTTTATINLYGVCASVTDNTSAATVTDKTVSQDNVNAEVDTALTDYDGPTKAELDAGLAALNDPTAAAIAEAVLKADWTTISGEASRSVLNALRFLRNKWTTSGGTLTVTKEDDSTSAWTSTLTSDSGADPITGSDPA